jgi:hypothetical protein
MHASTVVRAAIVSLTLLSRPAPAQVPASELTRTLTVPAPPDGDVPAPDIYVRKQMVTTLQFELPVRSITLSGTGAEHIAVQQFGPDAVILRPSKHLPSWQHPTLTVVAEDGARHAFSLVMDADEVDVQVRVQRGQCVTEPENIDALVAELLLRESVRTIRQLSFHQQIVDARTDGARLKMWGTLPMSRLAVVALRINSHGTPFTFEHARFESPIGRLKVLGTRPDAEGNIIIVVKRPTGEADGIAYTLRVSEKNGSRQFVARNVVPWPVPHTSALREPLGSEGDTEADPDGRGRNGEVPRTKRLESR